MSDSVSSQLARLAWPLPLILLCIVGSDVRGANTSTMEVSPDAASIVSAACTQCHSLRPIQLLRNGPQGWASIVEEMILRGAQINASEESIVVQYLSQAYGPNVKPTADAQGDLPGSSLSPQNRVEGVSKSILPPGEGSELVLIKCQMCHTLDRVVSVKRTRRNWQNVVDNMTGRGVSASVAEVQQMVNYLVDHYGKQAQTQNVPGDHE